MRTQVVMNKSDLIEFITSNFYEGNRFDFLLKLSGTFARLGVNMEILIDIYNKYLRPSDDENRIKIIKRTYERVEHGLPVVTLDRDDYITLMNILGIKPSVCHMQVRNTNINSSFGFIERAQGGISESELAKYVVPLDKRDHRLHYKYLVNNRNLPESIFDMWGIYVSIDEPDRVCFINKTSDGYIDLIIGRSIFDNYPKYKTLLGNTSRVLWNFRPEIIPRVIVEGIFDVMTVESYISGVNAVALLGKKINKFKLSLLRNSSEITIMLDSDVSNKEIKYLLSRIGSGIPTYVCKLPRGEDPNSLADRIVEIYKNREIIGGLVDV